MKDDVQQQNSRRGGLVFCVVELCCLCVCAWVCVWCCAMLRSLVLSCVALRCCWVAWRCMCCVLLCWVVWGVFCLVSCCLVSCCLVSCRVVSTHFSVNISRAAEDGVWCVELCLGLCWSCVLRCLHLCCGVVPEFVCCVVGGAILSPFGLV